MDAFSERLHDMLRSQGVSQRLLARHLQVTPGHVSRIVNGKTAPTEDLARRIDDYLQARGELAALNRPIICEGCGREMPRLRDAGERAERAQRERIKDRQSPEASNIDPVSRITRSTREHAERIEATGIGPSALAGLQANVRDLARTYVYTPPAPMLAEMDFARNRIIAALDQKCHPSQQIELHLLAGAICILLANAAADLGRHRASTELARSAWTYGSIIDHKELLAWSYGTQALAALLDERPDDAVEYAEQGLEIQRAGVGAARLHCLAARALTAAGASGQARSMLAEAKSAREDGTACELDLARRFGGEFTFDRAKQEYYAAAILIGIGDLPEALDAANTAIGIYEKRPWHDRSYGCLALARSQLALARLKVGNIESAGEALAPIFALPPAQRITGITRYLQAGGQLLSGPQFRGSVAARRLQARIEKFCTMRSS